MEKEEIIKKISENIALMKRNNKADRDEFQKMLFLALRSKVDKNEEIEFSVKFLMDIFDKVMFGTKIETILEESKKNENINEDRIASLMEKLEIIDLT